MIIVIRLSRTGTTNVTTQIYTHRSAGRDRDAAAQMASIILGALGESDSQTPDA